MRFSLDAEERNVMEGTAKTPKPPYYAVFFTSLRTETDDGYSHAAKSMVELASKQPGFLGVESVREENGLGNVPGISN